jgi:hypothetical protein
MYASIRHYRLDEGDMAEAMHRVDEHFADQLAEEPGFVAYEVIDCGDDELMSVTIFRDRDGAERSLDMAAAFIREHLADMEITRLSAREGELTVSRAANEVLEPAHA